MQVVSALAGILSAVFLSRKDRQAGPSTTADRHISERGLDLIRDYEGFSSTPYHDSAGHSTIGYGHRIRPGEQFSYVTTADGEGLLRDDVATAERAVHDLVTVPISQPQYDALVSFVYNLGRGALRSSTLLRRLNAGDEAAAADEFSRWVYAGGVRLEGLVRRRRGEADLFRTTLV